MNYSDDDRSDGLSDVEEILRQQRASATPYELDQIKLRAMTRADRSTAASRGYGMKRRFLALATTLCVGLGTTGAVALAGNDGGGGSQGGSGGWSQYKPPCPKMYGYDGRSCHQKHEGDGHGDGDWHYGHGEGWWWNGKSFQYGHDPSGASWQWNN